MDILDGQKSHGFPSDIKGIARSAARQLVLPSGNARRQAALENALRERPSPLSGNPPA
ncbi:hypothetical protein HW132_00620 [Brasilonema sp. CT11]|nr:hypothetical protein [Brasilonema sp. CT11]